MVKPEVLTVLESPAAQPDPLTEETLCDDILSCISALDEVIAEFDDSISHSSSSSITSGSGASLQKLQLAVTQAEPLAQKSSSVTSVESDEHDMDEEAGGAVRYPRLQVDCSVVGQRSSQGRPPGAAPIKPARQANKANGNGFQIEPHSTKSSNGNHLSYGIVFPKGSPSHHVSNNNNISVNLECSGTSTGSYPRLKTHHTVEACRHQSPKSMASSPQKSIPVTFVMKPEDLERFLQQEEHEEDWNCHIEKNLPRSLRKTRKTCFVEDDDEEQQKYCRSPKDFRKNLASDSPKRSPLLQRQPSVPKDPMTMTTSAEWVRYQDANGLRLQDPATRSPVNNNHVRNLNDLFQRSGTKTSPLTSPQPATVSTLDQVLDIDDGYLSMINRHEAPLLWPEGGIETETFTADELKKLSVTNLNYLNRSAKPKTKEQDYFSDDSLEFEGEPEFPLGKNFQTEKMSSFISAAASSSHPIVVQPFINKSSARKSWSPASEIRIPGKTSINTNTWRKCTNVIIDEQTEQTFVKRSLPVRKPCAFFIPMNPDQVKSEPVITTAMLLETMATRISREIVESSVREAACITSLLANPPCIDDLNVYEVIADYADPLVSVDLSGPMSPVNSSLGLSDEDRSGRLTSETPELGSSNSSSGIDYKTASEGQERTLDSLDVNMKGPDPPKVAVPDETIEDLYENPPPFIPPPPQQVVMRPTPVTVTRPASIVMETRPLRNSMSNPSQSRHSVGSTSEKDYFPDQFPSRDRPLRTQRQTSRSQENLLDLNRTEPTPHPCVRRGHSATLPTNAVPPTTTRRPSALRQFFGMFRRNKKHSTPSSGFLDHKDLGGSLSLYDDSCQLPEYYSPQKVNRPSVSDSHGSQRSTGSKASKRGVLARIFRRKEK